MKSESRKAYDVAYAVAYYAKNRERLIQRARAYRAKNPQKIRALCKSWRARHPEQVAAYNVAYRAKNLEENRERAKRWRLRNRLHRRIYSQKYWLKHRAKTLARLAVHRAVKRGKLIRPRSCSRCGRRCQPDGHHHRGYARKNWLHVIWLCRKCHKQTGC